MNDQSQVIILADAEETFEADLTLLQIITISNYKQKGTTSNVIKVIYERLINIT